VGSRVKTISSFSGEPFVDEHWQSEEVPNGGMEPTSHAGKVSWNSDSWASAAPWNEHRATLLKSTRRSAGSNDHDEVAGAGLHTTLASMRPWTCSRLRSRAPCRPPGESEP